MASILSLTFKIVTLSLILSSPAYAYLDPGTGSMIIQMAIAGIVSALFTIKMYWYRIKAAVYKIMGKEVEALNLDIESLSDKKAAENDKTKE